MTASAEPRATRSVGRIIFDLLLIAFCAAIVISAAGLRSGSGTVPLLIGIPTLIGNLAVLIRDLRQRADVEADPPSTPGGPGFNPTIIDPEAEEAETPATRRRQALFVGWILLFVALATATSFYIAIPVALLLLFVAIRLSPVAIIAAIGGVMVVLYALFELFLRIQL